MRDLRASMRLDSLQTTYCVGAGSPATDYTYPMDCTYPMHCMDPTDPTDPTHPMDPTD